MLDHAHALIPMSTATAKNMALAWVYMLYQGNAGGERLMKQRRTRVVSNAIEDIAPRYAFLHPPSRTQSSSGQSHKTQPEARKRPSHGCQSATPVDAWSADNGGATMLHLIHSSSVEMMRMITLVTAPSPSKHDPRFQVDP